MDRPTVKTGARLDIDGLGKCVVLAVPSWGDARVQKVDTGETFRVQGLFARFVVDKH